MGPRVRIVKVPLSGGAGVAEDGEDSAAGELLFPTACKLNCVPFYLTFYPSYALIFDTVPYYLAFPLPSAIGLRLARPTLRPWICIFFGAGFFVYFSVTQLG